MLSKYLRPQIRQHAVNALYNKRDVFLHDWNEACATTCALRIILSEQISSLTTADEEKQKETFANLSFVPTENGDKNNNNKSDVVNFLNKLSENFESLEANQQFRSSLREALFRIHVPRTITPTEVSATEYWAPLKFSSSSSSSSSTVASSYNNIHEKHSSHLSSSSSSPPFSETEFVNWIERTSNFPKSHQIGGELYVPLPCFVSSFETLARAKLRVANKMNFAKKMGENQSSNNEGDHNKIPQTHQNLHQFTSTEFQLYQDFIKWFGDVSGEKNNFDEFMCDSRGQLSVVMSPAQAKIMFRAMIVLAGSSDLQDFSKAMLKDLAIGDLLLVDESEASLKQFSYCLKKLAGGDKNSSISAKKSGNSVVNGGELKMKDLVARARTFLANNNNHVMHETLLSVEKKKTDQDFSSQLNNSPTIEYDPSKDSHQHQRGLRSSGGSTSIVNSANDLSSSTATNFLVSSSTTPQSFPPITTVNDDNNSTTTKINSPPKLPFSTRPRDQHNNNNISSSSSSVVTQGENFAEIDFNLCLFQSPVEPLFSDILKSSQDWWQLYRRGILGGGLQQQQEEKTKSFRVLKQLCDNVIFGVDDHGNAETQIPPPPENQILAPSRTKLLLADFDSQLFSRVSGDVGGYVVVAVPVFSSSRDNEDDQNGEDEEDFLLPQFSNGRVGKFPEKIFSIEYPLTKIWKEQFEMECERTNMRRKYLSFDARTVQRILFSEIDQNHSANNNEIDFCIVKELIRDPFNMYSVRDENEFAHENNTFGSISSTQLDRFLNLFDQFQKSDQENEQEDLNSSSAFTLRLTVYKCPPGLAGSLYENSNSKQNPDPRLRSKKTTNPNQKDSQLLLDSSLSLQETLRLKKLQEEGKGSGKQKENNASLLAVDFSNTFEYDNYLPRTGPQIPHHWCDSLPTFSYLDKTHTGRRKAEIERRNQGLEPHRYSQILFPSHLTRTHGLVNEGDEGENNQEEDEDEETNIDDQQKQKQFTSTNISEQEIYSKMSPGQRNEFFRQQKQQPKVSTSLSAAEKLRDAQMRFGMVGAIFKSELKRKQLVKTAGKKQLLRRVDRLASDERFFNEKVLPVGETALMLEGEMSKIKLRTPEQLANLKPWEKTKFSGPLHRNLKLGWAATKTEERLRNERQE